MLVMTALAPLREWQGGGLQVVGAGPDIEIGISIDHVMFIRPIAAEQVAGIEVDDIVGEDERGVRFRPGAHELMFLAERENVVPENIFLSVMLVEPGALAVVDDIIFEHDAGASFIGIKSPAAVGERVYVLNH